MEKYTQLIKLSMLQTTEYLLKSGKGFLFQSQGLKYGFDQGELNILRQFVEGKLDRDYILEAVGDKLGLGDMG